MLSAKVLIADARGAQSVLWQSDLVLVGRDSRCGVWIDHPMVSRQHCRIAQRDGRFILEDLGTPNGTYVNQQRVQGTVPLSHLDQIRCGPAHAQGPGLVPLPILTFQLIADEDSATYVHHGQSPTREARELQAARDELTRAQAQLQQSAAALAEERKRDAALRAEQQQALSERRALAEQVTALREELRLSRESAERAERHRADSDRRARAVQESLDQQGQEAARLRQEVEDKRQQVVGQERALRDRDSALSDLRAQLAQEQHRLSEARQLTAARTEGEREQQRQVLEQLRGERDAALRRSTDLAQQLQDKEAERARLAQQSRERETRVLAQDERLRDQGGQLQILNQQLAERDRRLDEEQKRAERLGKLNEEKNQQYRGHQDEIKRLEESLKKQQEALTREQLRAQRVQQDLSDQIEDLKRQLRPGG